MAALSLSLSFLAFCFVVCRGSGIVSPLKLIFLFSVLFYFSVFLGAVSEEVYFYYGLLMFSIILVSIFESSKLRPISIGTQCVPVKSYYILLFLALPGLSVKCFLVFYAGGWSEYISSLAFRVRDLSGNGWIVVVTSSVYIFFTYAFAIFIFDEDKSLHKKIVLGAIFMAFIVVSLTSGSRSAFVIPVVVLVLVVHYFKKEFSVFGLGLIGFFCLFFVGLLGAYRNNWGGEGVSLPSLSDLSIAHFYYGTNPIEIFLTKGEVEPLYGASYFSLITNFIPRSIFPDKPDTGGLIFTKVYTNDQWLGLSNLAPGVFVEGIMNFGWGLGVFFALVLLVVVFISAIKAIEYCLIICRSKFHSIYKKIFYAILSLNFLLVSARFSYSEFTNVFFSYIVFVVIPAYAAYTILRVRLQ